MMVPHHSPYKRKQSVLMRLHQPARGILAPPARLDDGRLRLRVEDVERGPAAKGTPP